MPPPHQRTEPWCSFVLAQLPAGSFASPAARVAVPRRFRAAVASSCVPPTLLCVCVSAVCVVCHLPRGKERWRRQMLLYMAHACAHVSPPGQRGYVIHMVTSVVAATALGRSLYGCSIPTLGILSFDLLNFFMSTPKWRRLASPLSRHTRHSILWFSAFTKPRIPGSSVIFARGARRAGHLRGEPAWRAPQHRDRRPVITLINSSRRTVRRK
jgi:hypothetical protein